MTERWRDELSKLRDLRVPERVWHRIEQIEPSTPSSRNLERIGTRVIALILATAGIGFAVWAFREDASRVNVKGVVRPSNGWVAFIGGDPSSFGVWVVDPANGEPLARGPRAPFGGVSGITWSPDGTYVAMARYADFTSSESDIFVMDAAGSELRDITADATAIVNASNPVWSPDGRRLVFVAETAQGNPDLFTVEPDGGNLRRLTHTPGQTQSPTWSPDGTAIAFEEEAPGQGYDIFSVASDGSDLVQLTDAPSHDSSPVWSPDGSRIAYVSASGGADSVQVMSRNGTAQLEVGDLGSDSIGEVSWAPDGRWLVVESYTAGNWDLWLLSAVGESQMRLTQSSGDENSPIWSPDGTTIAFLASPIDGHEANRNTFDIMLMEPDGSGMRSLTQSARAVCCSLSWQPVFVSPSVAAE